MEEVEKAIARRREEHQARLAEELSSLESLIWEMEETCQQPAGKLLQCVEAMAAAGSPVQDLHEEATCPICLDYFRDPVTIAECGHNFCGLCLALCCVESDTEASCPECRGTFWKGYIKPNRPLANFVEIAKKFRDQGVKAAEDKGRLCEKHQEPLKLFCKDHETPICVVCDRSKEHRDHEVVPLEEASQEYKHLIRYRLEILRSERERIMECKAETEKENRELLKQTRAEKKKTVSQFRELHQFLEEQEELLLAQLEEVEREIARRTDVHQAKLSEELSSLESLIQEMEKKCQQPAGELLQDVRSTLQRSEKETFEKSMGFPPELKTRISDFRDRNPFLEGVMKQFKANVTLDPGTANPSLILSEGHKSVRIGDNDQDLPKNPERFGFHLYVRGWEGFATGRHFWVAMLGRQETWVVGIARKSVRRTGMVRLILKEEASQEYKDLMLSRLEILRKEREKILAYNADAEKENHELLKQTKAEREKSVAQFRQLRQFLEEQEKRLLAQIEEVEKEIARKREEHLAILSKELSSLESLIQEMEKKCQQPASEFLQDIRSTLERFDEQEPPKVEMKFSPVLKWRIWEFCDITPFLEGIRKQFKGTLLSGLQQQKGNVHLDPDTAHPQLLLSEDRKCLKLRKKGEGCPPNPQRFDHYYFVLGRERFTSGRHFWDVVVENSEDWAVGVARKSVSRKGRFQCGAESGFWAAGKCRGEHTIPDFTDVSGNVKRIRVSLNCVGGRVAFYDVDTADCLAEFSAASFSGEVLLPFFYLGKKGHCVAPFSGYFTSHLTIAP
ncbi:E3 ubiquitin-protein ligase TRIM7-like [Elgaria multicarinata webbii]|uniref:E3 ubiquitin-protein ligase TRIM7-like n=1 Tax=Elgaria multicarinata webbii TaxID=159646 RepID=UPI002FCD529B